MTNEELCLRYQAGDEAAGDELIAQNEEEVRRLAVSYARQYGGMIVDEDDYQQKGLMALMRAAEHYRQDAGTCFLSYLRCAVKNAILDEIRRTYPPSSEQKEAVFDLISLTYKTDPEHILLQREEYERLYAAKNALSLREQVWIDWRYGFENGNPHALAEMAQEYQLSESRAKNMEKKALKKMKRHMEMKRNTITKDEQVG